MLKFFAIFGTILATLVACFMVAVNMGLLEPDNKVVEKVQTEEQSVEDVEEVSEKEPLAEIAENGYINGIYTATEPMFDITTGWRKVIKVEIRDGKIYDVKWDEEYKDGGRTKSELSQAGEYMMTEKSVPWHIQSLEAQDFVIDIANPEDLEDIDAISSVTIDSKAFLKLVKLCLAEAKAK